MTPSNRRQHWNDSRGLGRKATWCGLVFALAIVLTGLNICPPFDVVYRVSSKVVMPPTTLEQLKLQTGRSTSDGVVQITSIDVLDDADGGQDGSEGWLLVRLSSQWSERCTTDRHEAWLTELLNESHRRADAGDWAKASRFHRWQLAAAEHYVDHHEFLSTGGQGPGVATELASTSARQMGTLASYQPAASAGQSDTLLAEQLVSAVEQAKNHLTEAEAKLRAEVSYQTELIEVPVPESVSSDASRIPFWMTLSIVSLGLCAGALGGWCQKRMDSGVVFDSSRVALDLADVGLPTVSEIQVADANEKETTLGIGAVQSSRWSRLVARNFGRLSEWVVLGWAILLLLRFSGDPLWRSVFWDQPLAALARSLVGLP